jgi:hypothetical protein
MGERHNGIVVMRVRFPLGPHCVIIETMNKDKAKNCSCCVWCNETGAKEAEVRGEKMLLHSKCQSLYLQWLDKTNE